MSRRALFLAVPAAAGMLLLTACTSSDQGIAQNMRTESQGNVGADGSGAGDGSVTQPSDASGQGTDSSGQDVDASGQDTGEGAQQDAGEQEDASDQGVAADQSEGQTENQTEAPQTESSQETEVVGDIWSGTYASDQETVTIALIDAKSFSFSFANSGIASTAEIDGAQAIYKGDDHHVVVFMMNEGVLEIEVSSEEDFDASNSPLNGIYVRQTTE